MTQNNNDAILRAYTRLKALRQNLPKIARWGVEEKFVHEYHEILVKLESATEFDLGEFKIPDSEIQRKMESYVPANPLWNTPEETVYTEERYVDQNYMLSKFDAVLGYFEMCTSPEKYRIGFRQP